MTDDELFTIAEAKQMLKIGTTKIYEMQKAGDLEFVKLGPRATRVTGRSLRKLVGRIAAPGPGLAKIKRSA